MKVFSRAPLRIDFAGGWSDVPNFADGERGTVVNAAVAMSVRVEFRLGGRKIRLHAEDLGQRVTLESSRPLVYDGRLDLHKAALNLLPVPGGIEILSRSGAPPGSGLGGSGALDVALLAGLARCRCEEYEPAELAALAFTLEFGELGLLGGKQDQYAAALGGFLGLEFEAGEVRVRKLAVSQEAARELARHLVLVHTGETHFSSQTHERVWQAYAAGDAGVTDAIRAIRDVASEVGGVLEAGDWHRLAALVDENWRNQRALDTTIAAPAAERIDGAVRTAGAWGLKATGAGAGGCLVILCPPHQRARVTEAARANGGRILDVSFDFGGVTVWQREDAADHS